MQYQELRKYYDSRIKRFDPLEKRLAGEHLGLAALMEAQQDMDYTWDADELPPRKYTIHLHNLLSIRELTEESRPVYGRDHILEIRLTGMYPAEPPVCYMRTPVWHPNIQSGNGAFKGRICGNNAQFGAFFTLDELLWRIRDMLSYKIYHARMYYPFPEDEVAARWVLEYGEPMKIIKAGVGILADENLVTEPLPEKENPIRVVQKITQD